MKHIKIILLAPIAKPVDGATGPFYISNGYWYVGDRRIDISGWIDDDKIEELVRSTAKALGFNTFTFEIEN